MVIVLILGGLLALYVNYDTRKKTAQADERAKQSESQNLISDGIKNSLALIQAADVGMRQNLKSANFYFEFANDNDQNVEPSPNGFIGPLPIVPGDAAGVIVISLGDVGFAEYGFRRKSDTEIEISDTERRASFILRNQEIDPIYRDKKKNKENSGGPFSWWAQQEPAPNGFVYGMELPLSGQLRRVINKLATDNNFGHVRFQRGRVGADILQKIEAGFSKLTPTYVIALHESAGRNKCMNYLRVPLSISKESEFEWNNEKFDAFTFRLTPQGFKIETCENNPF